MLFCYEHLVVVAVRRHLTGRFGSMQLDRTADIKFAKN
jgi:hypothetical protein